MRSTETATWFFTFLTLVANIATVGLVTLSAGRLVSPWARTTWVDSVEPELEEGGVAAAWVVAGVCMGGSLWFSEVASYPPCRLCWFQRACMYPLVVVLAVAHLGRERWARYLGLGLATVGAGIATYHVLVERYPSLEPGSCDPDVPCSLVWFERLGFVTLPYMALSGFLLIAVLLAASKETP